MSLWPCAVSGGGGWCPAARAAQRITVGRSARQAESAGRFRALVDVRRHPFCINDIVALLHTH